MITREELKTLLKNAGFEEAIIERILKKKINTLLRLGNFKNIQKILDILNDNKISHESVAKCLTVLTQGKADEIEKILGVLDKHSISKEKIENCLTVLTRGKAEEIEKIFKVLDSYDI